jgi:hypothetical protein
MGKGGSSDNRRVLDLEITQKAPNSMQAAKLRAIGRTHGSVRVISVIDTGVVFTTPVRFTKRGEFVPSQAGRVDPHGAIAWSL